MEEEIAIADLSEFSCFKLQVLWMYSQKFSMDLFMRTNLGLFLYYASDISEQPIWRFLLPALDYT